jgi:hypothetical protein
MFETTFLFYNYSTIGIGIATPAFYDNYEIKMY